MDVCPIHCVQPEVPRSTTVSMKKSNGGPHLQLNWNSSVFMCFIYWGCAKAFVQYKDYAIEKTRANRKEELQQTYHYMPFSLLRCHLNLFIFP